MANKSLRSLQFPGLNDTYTIPEIDDTLAVAGKAADSKAVGDALTLKVPNTRKVNNKALSADVTLDAGDIGYNAEIAYTDGTTGKALNSLKSEIMDLETKLKSGDEEDADLHLGFYLDENGDLCQVEEE